MTYHSTLTALADPMRRRILERLRERPTAVGDLARGLPVSRPAVSQHLRVLREAGLVSETREGTRRIYRVDVRGLAELREWVERFWSDALAAFAAHAEATHAETPPNEDESKVDAEGETKDGANDGANDGASDA